MSATSKIILAILASKAAASWASADPLERQRLAGNHCAQWQALRSGGRHQAECGQRLHRDLQGWQSLPCLHRSQGACSRHQALVGEVSRRARCYENRSEDRDRGRCGGDRGRDNRRLQECAPHQSHRAAHHRRAAQGGESFNLAGCACQRQRGRSCCSLSRVHIGRSDGLVRPWPPIGSAGASTSGCRLPAPCTKRAAYASSTYGAAGCVLLGEPGVLRPLWLPIKIRTSFFRVFRPNTSKPFPSVPLGLVAQSRTTRHSTHRPSRTDPGSSPCSTQRRMRRRTAPAHRRCRRPRRELAIVNWSRTPDRREWQSI